MRQPMLDELDPQDYFATVLLDGHNGEFDLTKVSDDPWLPIIAAAEDSAYYTPEQEQIIATERYVKHALRSAFVASDLPAFCDWGLALIEFDQDPAGFCGVTV